jgi:hypothetical protein
MKDLNWFQAEALGVTQLRAVRRAAWKFWIIFRANVWIVSDSSSGTEKRRVVQTTDFKDSEFLAKDWTDEPGENMTIPPCSNPVPATTVPPLLGSGLWSLTPFCGGDGQGGNVFPIGGPGITEPELPPMEIEIMLADGSNDPVVTDGAGCWVTEVVANSLFVMVRLSAGIPLDEVGGNYVIYMSETGASLVDPISFGDPIPGVTRQLTGSQGSGPGDASAHFDATWDGIAWPNAASPSTNADPIDIAAGATVTVRVDYFSPLGNIFTAFAEVEMAPLC